MSFLGNIGSVIKSVATPVLKSVGQDILKTVGKGALDILEGLAKSLFEGGAKATSADTAKSSALPHPSQALNKSTGSTAQSTSAVTAPKVSERAESTATAQQAVTSAVSGGKGTVLDQLGSSSAAFDWKSLTPTQSQMLKDSGIDANSPEGKRMIMQFKMQNYSEVMQLISNLSKQLSDISKAIIANIR